METTVRERQLLTLPEVAEVLRVSVRTVRRYIAGGHFPAVQPGGKHCVIRIPKAELREWLKEQRTNWAAGGSSPFSPPVNPAERRETSEAAGQSSSQQPAGELERKENE